MKKKIFVCAFIAVCLSIVAYGTTAYFTYDEKATNVITAGNIKIELQEWTVTEAGIARVSNGEEVDVLPGIEVSRIVKVKNIGMKTAWIRVSVEKSLTLAENVSGTADASLVSYDLNTDYWMEKDGYYYYKEELEPGEITENLFTKVIFSPAMNDMYQQSKAIIDVSAQATQFVNNGTDVFEAAGWPNAD